MHKTKLVIDKPFRRLDQAICFYDEVVVRSSIRESVADVSVNGIPVRKLSVAVQAGDVVEYALLGKKSDEDSPLPPPELDIRFENDDFLVIEKKAGICTHHGIKAASGTIEDALLQRYGERPDMVEYRNGIVHRLDKETSGLMILAKNAAAARFFINQFKERQVYKEYRAIVKSAPRLPAGSMETGLRRSMRNRLKFEVCGIDEGKIAVTDYRVLENYGDVASLLSVVIKTGRTHQIRVHMQSMGCPVLGDDLYARAGKFGDMGLMLYCRVLRFVSPDGIAREFECGEPDRFVAMREKLAGIAGEGGL